MARHEPKPPDPVGYTLFDTLAVAGLVFAILLLVAAVVMYLI